MLAELLPDTVRIVSIRGDHLPDRRLHADEAISVDRAIAMRRHEFARGRACAHMALTQLGLPDSPIRRAADGAPIWPAGIVGSISHVAGYCAAALARRRDVAALGIDVDTRDALPDEIRALVFRPNEFRQLTDPASGTVDVGKLMFICKESVYKCYRALHHAFVDFHDVALELDVQKGTFRPFALNPIHGLADVCDRLRGRFAWDECYVYATAVICSEAIGASLVGARSDAVQRGRRSPNQ